MAAASRPVIVRDTVANVIHLSKAQTGNMGSTPQPDRSTKKKVSVKAMNDPMWKSPHHSVDSVRTIKSNQDLRYHRKHVTKVSSSAK